MHRILIADTTQTIGKALNKQLKNKFQIRLCHDGKKALELIRTYEPDILVLDTMLPGVDSLTLLRVLRTSARNTKVIAISRATNEYIVGQLMERGVSYVLTKPCAIGLVSAHICQMSFRLEHPDLEDWCIEIETDVILLSLGFRMGPSRYDCVFQAVIKKYENPTCSMKELYIDVARICGGNFKRVEKAIRDAIEDAYENADRELWELYFPPSRKQNKQMQDHQDKDPNGKRRKACPNNEDFIARIARCHVHRARIRKPIALWQEKAQ